MLIYTKKASSKKELAKDPALAEEDWSRFLPNFKKKNTSKRRKPHVLNEKKSYTPFPPAPVPSKVDLQLESGEYFINEAQRQAKKKSDKRALSKEKAAENRLAREAEYVPPNEDDDMGHTSSRKREHSASTEDAEPSSSKKKRKSDKSEPESREHDEEPKSSKKHKSRK